MTWCIVARNRMSKSLTQTGPAQIVSAPTGSPRIGILVVAYNAASTLAKVLDRVPTTFRPRITQVFVCDDASQDSTYLVGLGYKQITDDLPLTIIRHPSNLGYGGNQKAGYRLAIEHDLDIIVLLHGDGQYAPECLEDIVRPLERGECDAVLGSRMMVKGAARKGGMPLYKYVGNRILTRFENRMLGTDLSEFHSGYRAYSVKALASIPFEANADGFNFDTEIIIQLVDAGRRIVEVPIPTYYGEEICYVDGMKYAKDVSLDVLRYRFAKLGFTSGDMCSVGEAYAIKPGEESSHSVVLRWLEQLHSRPRLFGRPSFRTHAGARPPCHGHRSSRASRRSNARRPILPRRPRLRTSTGNRRRGRLRRRGRGRRP
jgi:glycosyltransferase involved in cell wall biosynthesis